jgi:hypothetical protein
VRASIAFAARPHYRLRRRLSRQPAGGFPRRPPTRARAALPGRSHTPPGSLFTRACARIPDPRAVHRPGRGARPRSRPGPLPAKRSASTRGVFTHPKGKRKRSGSRRHGGVGTAYVLIALGVAVSPQILCIGPRGHAVMWAGPRRVSQPRVAVAQSRFGKAAARSRRWPSERLGLAAAGWTHLA